MVINEFVERYQEVTDNIEQACKKAGRSMDDIKLVAVSKTWGADAVQAIAECGQQLFGENKVQEAQVKIPHCPGHLTWHMIGHLQRNKTPLAVRLFDMIHSVDSIRLLEAVEKSCDQQGKSMPVCLEVNVSGERSKFGASPEDVPKLLEAAQQCRYINVEGVMTIPPFAEDPEKSRPFFARLRELRDQWQQQTGFELNELSMGMTNDYTVAIEEGATFVRIGTALFGTRGKKNDD